MRALSSLSPPDKSPRLRGSTQLHSVLLLMHLPGGQGSVTVLASAPQLGGRTHLAGGQGPWFLPTWSPSTRGPPHVAPPLVAPSPRGPSPRGLSPRELLGLSSQHGGWFQAQTSVSHSPALGPTFTVLCEPRQSRRPARFQGREQPHQDQRRARKWEMLCRHL